MSRTPERVTARPSSLPDADRGHGVFITVYSDYGFEGSVFLDRDQAVVLRDEIDQALERDWTDRAAA